MTKNPQLIPHSFSQQLIAAGFLHVMGDLVKKLIGGVIVTSRGKSKDQRIHTKST